MGNQPIPDPGNPPSSQLPQQPLEASPVQPQVITPQSVTPVAEQPSVTAYSSPQDITTQPAVFTSAPQPTNMTSPAVGAPKRRNPLKFILITLLVIFVLLAGGYLLITQNNKAAKFTYDHTVKGSQPSSGITTSTTSDLASEKDIAFGSTATDGTFQVKLLGVTPDPTITGDQPDAGTEYVEADFSVTSVANKNNYAFNMSYLPSIVPAGDKMGNIEFSPVDSTAGTTSPITFDQIPAKTVQIASKNSAEGYTIPSDGSAKTVTVYALFEIKQGDKEGQIVWQGLDGGNYHFLTQ